MRLMWSASALADRDHIFTHIEADSPRAAFAVGEHIAQAVLRLVEFPEAVVVGRGLHMCHSPVCATPMSDTQLFEIRVTSSISSRRAAPSDAPPGCRCAAPELHPNVFLALRANTPHRTPPPTAALNGLEMLKEEAAMQPRSQLGRQDPVHWLRVAPSWSQTMPPLKIASPVTPVPGFRAITAL